MVESAPAPLSDQSGSQKSERGRNLLLRVATALVLAPIAVAAAWVGGWPFVLFWGLAGIGVWWEWTTLVAGPAARLIVWTGGGALVLALALAGSGRVLAALSVVLLGAGATNVVAPTGRGTWVGGGVIYSGLIFIAPIMLRQQEGSGFAAIIFIFAVVWTTDILAYFVGSIVGGAKLWPRISPNKTWSGALAGALGSIIAALIFAAVTETGFELRLALVALGLSVASQAGDLFESAVKRRFGAKDAGRIIPGHGGLMDRLDGFVAAAAVAALYAGVPATMDGAGQGLLQW